MLIGSLFVNILYLLLGFIELILSLRFVLLFFAVNNQNGLVNWIYESSTPFVTPFFGIFSNITLANGMVIEWASIIALAGYALISAVISALSHTVLKKPKDS